MAGMVTGKEPPNRISIHMLCANFLLFEPMAERILHFI